MSIIDELIAVLGYDVQNEGELKRYNQSLDSLEKKAYAVGRAIGRTAAIAGTVAAAGFALLGKGVIDTTAKFEGYQATLETIEGSTEKAKAALDWVSKFAATTPYDVDEVTQAFVKLRAYGMDPMDGTLLALGDTASGMGKNLMQSVEALADAATGEFERIKEFGVKAKVAGDDVTFSWIDNGKAMTKTVKKNGLEITKTLKDIWGKRFQGAMIRQSKTWNGMMSNLGDSWTGFLRRIGEAGVFDRVKSKVADLMDRIQGWADDGTMDKVAKAISGAFETVADFLAAVAVRIATAVSYISKNFEALKPYLSALGIAFGILMAAAFPVTSVILGLGLAIDDLIAYLTGGESVIGDFIGWIKSLGDAFANTTIGGALVKSIQDIAKYFSDAGDFVRGFIDALAFDGSGASGALQTVWEVAKGLGNAFKSIIADGARLLEWAIPDDFFGVNAFETGKKAAENFIAVINYLIELPGKIIAAFVGLGQKIADQINAGAAAVKAAIAALVPGIIDIPVQYNSNVTGADVGANIGNLANPPKPRDGALPPTAPPSSPVPTSPNKPQAFNERRPPTYSVQGQVEPIPTKTPKDTYEDRQRRLANFMANSNRVSAGSAPASGGAAIANDNSTKNVNTTVNSTVNQTIQTPAAAPAAVAAATNQAVGKAATGGATRIETEATF